MEELEEPNDIGEYYEKYEGESIEDEAEKFK